MYLSHTIIHSYVLLLGYMPFKRTNQVMTHQPSDDSSHLLRGPLQPGPRMRISTPWGPLSRGWQGPVKRVRAKLGESLTSRTPCTPTRLCSAAAMLRPTVGPNSASAYAREGFLCVVRVACVPGGVVLWVESCVQMRTHYQGWCGMKRERSKALS